MFAFLSVVVTLSFNAKMVLANFECNLNDLLLPEMAPRRWPVFCGNIEEAGLKQIAKAQPEGRNWRNATCVTLRKTSHCTK